MTPHTRHAQCAPIRLRLKAVPGASRDQIAGVLGDRIKVRISAAPEGGKANKAICKLFAKALKIKPANIEIIAGHTNPEKTIQIDAIEPDRIAELLELDLDLVAFSPKAH